MHWALSWPWLALALLGAYHGLNPGMGWLFAVARGLQEGSRGAVVASLLPILIGHEASVVVVVGAAVATQELVPPHTVRLRHARRQGGACCLVLSHGFGTWSRSHARARPARMAPSRRAPDRRPAGNT